MRRTAVSFVTASIVAGCIPPVSVPPAVLEAQLWERSAAKRNALGEILPPWSTKNGRIIRGLYEGAPDTTRLGTPYMLRGLPGPYDDASAYLAIICPLPTETVSPSIFVITSEIPLLEETAEVRVDSLAVHTVPVRDGDAYLFWPRMLALADWEDFRDELREGSRLLVQFKSRIERIGTFFVEVDLAGFEVEETAFCASP